MNIDQFLELAKKRRSIRLFKPDPIPDECIEKILEAARWAMSGANGQPWEFIVVKDEETKTKLAAARHEAQKLTIAMEVIRIPEMRQPRYRKMDQEMPKAILGNAPAIIVICGDPRTAQASVLNRLSDRRWIIDENMANTTQVMHLAVAACGLGSQWVTIDRLCEELMKPILGVPPVIRLFSMVTIGYAAHEPKSPYRRELEEIVHREKYDMNKYRSHDDVQSFIRNLRGETKRAYPLK
jgi:nitroreductase